MYLKEFDKKILNCLSEVESAGSPEIVVHVPALNMDCKITDVHCPDGDAIVIEINDEKETEEG